VAVAVAAIILPAEAIRLADIQAAGSTHDWPMCI
jgi:hypothetical protein